MILMLTLMPSWSKIEPGCVVKPWLASIIGFQPTHSSRDRLITGSEVSVLPAEGFVVGFWDVLPD